MYFVTFTLGTMLAMVERITRHGNSVRSAIG
jgi:hypothetical protein